MLSKLFHHILEARPARGTHWDQRRQMRITRKTFKEDTDEVLQEGILLFLGGRLSLRKAMTPPEALSHEAFNTYLPRSARVASQKNFRPLWLRTFHD